jgi:hypothetical protein
MLQPTPAVPKLLSMKPIPTRSARVANPTFGSATIAMLARISTSSVPASRRVVPSFDGPDGLIQCLLKDALADGPEHDAEEPSLEVLAVAYDDHVLIGGPVGLGRECVGLEQSWMDGGLQLETGTRKRCSRLPSVLPLWAGASLACDR